MRSVRTAVAFLLAGACLAVTIPGAANGGRGAAPKVAFTVPLPESGQIVLAKLVVAVKSSRGKPLPKKIQLKLNLQGSLPQSVAVIAGPSQLIKTSRSKGQLVSYVEVINKREAPAAASMLVPSSAARPSRATSPQGVPDPFSVLLAIATTSIVLTKTAAALTISGGLTVGSCASCKPLSGAAKRTSCTNNLKQLGLALHTLAGANVLGETSPQDAWSAGWGLGCGEVQPQLIRPYANITGKNPNCILRFSFGSGPFSDDNQLDLSGCPRSISVSSVALLSPNGGWSTPITRWSDYAVVGTGTFYTGPCRSDGWDQPAASPWPSGVRCDLSKPMVGGSDQHFVVAFGPKQPVGTPFALVFLDPTGQDWVQPGDTSWGN